MAAQTPQRVRRNGSPSTKQGPMKATVPVPLMTCSPAKKCSPSSSPIHLWSGENHKNKRRSPENRTSPERSSPLSPCFKGTVEKPKPVKLGSGSSIHRARSLENFTGPYLTGQWPRDLATCLPSPTLQPPVAISFTSDKATQTEDWDTDEKKKKAHNRSSSLGNSDALNIEKFKQRLQKGNKQNASTRERASPVHGDHALAAQSGSLKTGAVPINIPHIPKTSPRVRGSVEGFNMEVEKFFPKSLEKFSGTEEESSKVHDSIPEGHRAPVAELLLVSNTRSVDTQTPSKLATPEGHETTPAFQEETSGTNSRCSGGNSSSSSRAASESPDSYIPGPMDTDSPQVPEAPDEKMELDDQGKLSSPKPNQSFRREPPDGCEKVKTVEEVGPVSPTCGKDVLPFCPVPLKSSKYCIPSVDSAFCPLYKSYVSQVTGASNPAMRSSPVESQ